MDVAESTYRRPIVIYLLMAAILVQGLSGVLGGIGLIADPTGRLLGIRDSWLDGSAFDSYLIPGLILVTLLGILPVAVAYAIWKRLPWAWNGSLFVGIALVVWILVEILIIGFQTDPPLQFIYGVLGLIILLLVAHPAALRFARTIRPVRRPMSK